ncbi:sugar transporter [Vibrio tritonius]|uniref:Sugar transporter n=1 Tax=Vibrio tritonius TaxID=1435069 RepID=A0ABS7YT75_9VIBR|nr:sugar transporter [Vibrio tritonius]MCA2018895.1 sugar transporter [Vibrio tritonius]
MNQTLASAPPVSRHSQYMRVFALGFSGFIFNTTEFVPVGLLSDIAKDFDITAAHAGWMLTIYAWIVASMSLPMMMLTSKIERKKLLIGIFMLFIASHVASVFAWSFESLIASRVGIAFAHAVFWSITASIAIRVAPPGKKTFALSVLATGTSVAMILGVPMGRIIGQWFGWRATFGLIAAVAFIVMLILIRLLPQMPSLFKGTSKTLPRLLKNPMLMGLYLFIFLLFTAHYTAYSYIEPFMMEVGKVSPNFTTLLLLAFGGAGIIGSIIFSYLGEKHNTSLLMWNGVLMVVCMALLLVTVFSPWAVMTDVIIWGIALTLVTLAMQVKVLNIDADASDMIQSMYSGIINLGIGSGALIGAKVIQWFELSWVGFAGVIFAAVAIIFMMFLLRRYPALR